MPVTSSSPAPYAPTKAVLEIVERYRAKGLPTPINLDVLSRIGISDSLTQRTLQAIQTLDLIDDKGAPTATFESIRLAPEAEYKSRLAQWLNASYADVLKFIDPATASDTALQDAFRSYNPPGQRPRMVTLFTGLFAAAGISAEKPKSVASRARRPAPQTNGAKRTAAKTSGEENNDHHDVPPPPPPPPARDISDKALEYKLVDLMKNPDIQEAERAAVWTLIQYLTTRAHKAESGNR